MARELTPLDSCYLSASAGSGKTFALSKRFCHQVMLGVAPECICALTFTRPATRGIFSAIIEHFIRRDIEVPPKGCSYEEALRRILEALPRLQIATIDAFSAKVARLFAYELGFPPEFRLYAEGMGSAEGLEALQAITQRVLQLGHPKSLEARFDELDVQYDFIPGKGSFFARLETKLATQGAMVLDYPTGWGVYPDQPNVRVLTDAEIEDALLILEQVPDHYATIVTKFTDAAQKSYQKIWSSYRAYCSSVRTLAREKSSSWFAHFCDLVTTGTFIYRKTSEIRLEPIAQGAVKALFGDMVARDLAYTARYTKATYHALSLLHQAAEVYRRETGRYGFSELTRQLSLRAGGQLSFSDAQGLNVAYRMDTTIHHLMVDEFQDTSATQWSILSRIARELTENKDRSFFYVGDAKQSIYAWRGADASLFSDRKRLPEKILPGEPLVMSYRSCPTIIDFINQAMSFPLLERYIDWQRTTLERWHQGWQDHCSAIESVGRVAWYKVDYASAGRGETLSGSVDPLERAAQVIADRCEVLLEQGKKIAVLARKNKVFQGSEGTRGLLDHLRERKIACAIDGKRLVKDTPMGQLVVALLHWMADPRATLWGEVAYRLHLVDSASHATLETWMRTLTEEGFVVWLDSCFHGMTLTPYDREILAALRQGLEALDVEGCVDPARAVNTLEQLNVACHANEKVVNLMTIHRSKGLTYDVVFTYLDEALGNLSGVVFERGDRWIFAQPRLQQTVQALPSFVRAQQLRREQLLMDDLCVTYVALTRASREQIIFSRSDRVTSDYNAGLLLQHFEQVNTPHPKYAHVTLAFEMGDADWWKPNPDVQKRLAHKDEVKINPTSEVTTWQCVKDEAGTEVELPSESVRESTLSEILDARAYRAASYGTSQHVRLAQMAWTDHPPRGFFKEVFATPDEPCELWRERSFAVRLSETDGLHYYAGQFDRVHLYPMSRRAIIYDFKTSHDAICTPAYERQLRDYQKALAVLTGYPREQIRMVLLFTRTGVSVEVPHV